MSGRVRIGQGVCIGREKRLGVGISISLTLVLILKIYPVYFPLSLCNSIPALYMYTYHIP